MANIITGRKSGFITRGNRNVRATAWIASAAVASTLTAPAQASNLTLLSGIGLALRPFTVVRTRGILHMHSDQSAADEFQDVAYGQAKISEQAAAIGVTAMPTPDTDVESDLWFVYERIMSQFLFVTAAGVESVEGVMILFDSKSMRKVEDGEQLASVVEAGSLSDGFTVTAQFRQLIKLH